MKYCSNCLDLKEKLKAAQSRCTALELQIEMEKNEVKLLQQKLVALEEPEELKTKMNIAPTTPAKISNSICRDDENDDLIVQSCSPQYSTQKRKRACNVIHIDSESDDDNLPLSILTRRSEKQSKDYVPKEDSMKSTDSEDEVKDSGKRRRLVKLNHYEDKGNRVTRSLIYQKSLISVSDHNDDVKEEDELDDADHNDDDKEEDESDDAADSMGSFIVYDDDDEDDDVDDDNDSNSNGICDGDNGCSNNDVSEASDSSDSKFDSDNETIDDIMSKLRRKKAHRSEWKYEGEMLSDFMENDELCLKALCALYRMQTDDEKDGKCTVHRNGRGFSQLDALRGSYLGKFLTDEEGNLIKSVKELQEHDPCGVKMCRELARKYSKQLFEIYRNKEDPLFHP